MRTTLLALCSLVTLSLSAPPLIQRPLSMSDSSASLAPGYHTLTDALTSSRQSSLYYDYLRLAAPVALHAALALPPPAYSTLLVPTNSAILSLARKPHQGPANPVRVDVPEGMVGTTVIDEQKEEEAREKYLARWLERHALKGRVDLDGEGWEAKSYTAFDGAQLTFGLSEDGETRVVNPGAIAIVDAKQVSRPHETAPTRTQTDSAQTCTSGADLLHCVDWQVDNGVIYFLSGSLTIDDE